MEEQEVVVTPKTKINKLSIIIAVVLTAVTSVFASFFFLKDYYMVEPTTYTKLTEIQELIDKYYYGEVDPEELEKSVLSGFVYGTGDKYAAYYDISDSEKRSDSLSGNESGIGIMVT